MEGKESTFAGAAPVAGLAIVSSLALAAVKIATGIAGSSSALIADGIESLADAAGTSLVLLALWYSARPADDNHPYGHGKAESLAALGVAAALLFAAGLIAWRSVIEIQAPHQAPAWFTLPVLTLVIVVKVIVARRLAEFGRARGSLALETDASHHASDAWTSGAAFIGIAIALFAGPGWEAADDWAALAACGIIVFNAIRLGRRGLDELMDASADPEVERVLVAEALTVPGVRAIEKRRVRKSGTGYLMDIHVEVERTLTVEQGHDIARAVKNHLIDGGHRVLDVTVHVEPWHGE
ncbi:MAG: cation transporter [Candidatus Sumerlaeia bacterium]|nr:cation transporter [Candidatus Sumerlaeia bacterium]